MPTTKGHMERTMVEKGLGKGRLSDVQVQGRKC